MPLLLLLAHGKPRQIAGGSCCVGPSTSRAGGLAYLHHPRRVHDGHAVGQHREALLRPLGLRSMRRRQKAGALAERAATFSALGFRRSVLTTHIGADVQHD